MIDGLMVVDKPAGVTSHDVVSWVRRLARQKRVGHAGTLDPDATGVLIVGLGRATKLLTYIVGESKIYRATIRLGVRTVTEDAAGQWVDAVGAVLGVDSGGDGVVESVVSAGFDCEPRSGVRVSVEQIDRAIASLTGEILQVPSRVSAIKVAGKRAYERVRSGEDVQLSARPVTIHRFERLTAPEESSLAQSTAVSVVDFEVEVVCSSGTYIRALARDLGEMLGCGAHLVALRRTRVGEWTLADAVELPELPKLTGKSSLSKKSERASRDPDFGQLELPEYLTLSQAALRLFPRAVLGSVEFDKFLHGVAPKTVLSIDCDGRKNICPQNVGELGEEKVGTNSGAKRETTAEETRGVPSICAVVSKSAPVTVAGLIQAVQVKSDSAQAFPGDTRTSGCEPSQTGNTRTEISQLEASQIQASGSQEGLDFCSRSSHNREESCSASSAGTSGTGTSTGIGSVVQNVSATQAEASANDVCEETGKTPKTTGANLTQTNFDSTALRQKWKVLTVFA